MGIFYKKSDIPDHLQKYFVPAEIGLEQTPEQYIAAMVEVFRCVRDVLADDGMLWLNLGSSYASGDKTPSQSLLRQRVPPCDTRGTAPQDSQGAGRACLGSYDEPQGETRCHRENNAHTCRCDEQVEPQIEPTSQGNEHLGCDQSSRLTFQPGDHPSTTDATSQNVQDALHPSGEALACQRAPRTSLRDAQEFSDKSACTCGTSRMLQPLAVHTKGKESFFSACRRSDCNGIGRCGYCFGSLTTASLSIKQKDELNIPHLVAMALQADGWVLRQTICWAKPNPMPESVRDRCTKAHEYVFLLSKSERYFFDSEAMREDAVKGASGSSFNTGKTAAHQMGRSSDAERVEDGKRNRRSVWTVATKPYNGKKALTDYVGDDGKPYTASPDCPIHGHLARRQTSGTHGYGGQQGQSQTGSAGTCAHHAQSPACGEQSTTSRSSQASGAGNSRQHTPESSHENKTDSRLSGHTSGDGNQSCSGCKSASGEHQDCGKDCSHQSSSSTATSHNTGTSKTARAPATIRPCMPCAETDNRTQSTSDQRGLFEQDHGISESSILTGETSVHPSQDTRICNAGTSSELVSMACEVGEKCTCNEVIIDHFATFPPALVEPCILAGSRPGDIVLDPFMGSGTTAAVAIQYGRQYLGCELNAEYGALQAERINEATEAAACAAAQPDLFERAA